MILKDDSKGRWFTYEDDIKFKLKYTPDLTQFTNDFEIFDSFCEDWQGIETKEEESDKVVPLECTRINKANFLLSDYGKEAYVWMLVLVTKIDFYLDMESLKKKLPERFAGALTSPRQAL